MVKEYFHNGIKYSVTPMHSGQYRRYGDSHKILHIETSASKEETLQFLKEQFGYDVPHKNDWNTSTPDQYFAGYYTIEQIFDGWLYDKCEPYTD